MKNTLHFRSNSKLRFRPFFLTCGLLMLFSEIWKQLCLMFIVNNGSYYWWYFPFQLCSIPMYILLILPHTKKEGMQGALLTFLMTFGLLGGAIVFADTTGLHYKSLPILTVHSYLWHILLVIIGFVAGIAYSERPALRDFRNATFLYLFCCVTATAINLVFDRFGTINMFYINPTYRMEQIVFSELVPVLGNNTIIALYIFMTIVGAGLVWLFWKVFYFLIKRYSFI